MLSNVKLANMVLSHLGVGRSIVSLENDESEDSDAINEFWDVALADHFRAFPWPFARRILALALLEEDPNSEWKYAYRYPTACAMVRRAVNGNRTPSRAGRNPFWVGGDDSGQIVYSDIDDLEVEYTAIVEDESKWPTDFAMSFTVLLAYYCAPRLAKGTQAEITAAQRALLQKYAIEVERARVNSANEEQPDAPGESEFITERNS